MLSGDPLSFAGLFIYIYIYLFYLPCKAQDSIMNLKDCLVHALYKIRIVSVCKIQNIQYRFNTGVCTWPCMWLLNCVDFTADTEGSFIVERVVDIADAAVKHMQHVVQSADMDETGTISWFWFDFSVLRISL